MNDKPNNNALTFNQRLSQNHQLGFNSMKSSVIVPGTKNINQGLTFSNQRQDIREMSKSYIQKEPPHDVQSFMRQVKTRFLRVEQTLSQHDTQLISLRKESKSFGSYSMSTGSSTDSFSIQMARSLREGWQNDLMSLRNKLYQEIQRLRVQINQGFPRKNQLDFTLSRIETKIIEVVKNNNPGREITEMKQKIGVQCRGVYERISQELNSKINSLSDQYRIKFNQMQQQMSEVKRKFEIIKEQVKPTVFTSNQKFYSPRLVKYKQVIQKLPGNSYQKAGEEIVINQIIYYMDKDGKLLDSSHHYLVDKNNKEIQIDYKQLAILNVHDMLI